MPQHKLLRPFSIYLDFVRATAAIAVLLFHAAGNEFGGKWLQPFVGHSGTLGVIAFFVLSGFVISYTADTKEREFGIYITNRLARLWSVVIPALALTVVADFIGRHANPSIYPAWYLAMFTTASAELLASAKLVTTALFVNQIWGFESLPLSNGPFWSLCYEFWYYVCFGLLLLIPGHRGKWLAAAALIAMGPKIWILFPVWMIGVLVYRQLSRARKLPLLLAIAAFASPLGMHWIIEYHYTPNIADFLVANIGDKFVGFSRAIDLAIIFGPMMAANIFAAVSLSEKYAPILLAAERPIRWLAGATLSIYLYHYPLLFMFGALFKPQANAWPTNLLIIVCVLTIVFILQPFTEAKKNYVRSQLQSVVRMITRRFFSGARIAAARTMSD
jgi:peptidoglycan/LPS O-acetylase OafA/YrhL